MKSWRSPGHLDSIYELAFMAHSWFANVVDGNELGPFYPFQLKQLRYEEGAVGATIDLMVHFGIDIHIPLKKI